MNKELEEYELDLTLIEKRVKEQYTNVKVPLRHMGKVEKTIINFLREDDSYKGQNFIAIKPFRFRTVDDCIFIVKKAAEVVSGEKPAVTSINKKAT